MHSILNKKIGQMWVSKATNKMASLLKLFLNTISVLRLADWHCFALFFLLFTCESLESHEDKSENYLLCKYCGADAADLEYAFTIKSPVAVKIENQTFSGKEVVVQTLKNPSNIYFEVITVKKSNCIGYGEWTKHDSWFPGFAWKLCVCQPWGHFLGWVFEPFDLIRRNQKKASERVSVKLTEEQQKFLNSLEEEFKNRYTEDDKEFKALLNEELPLPPVIENWRDFGQNDARSVNERNDYNRNRNRFGYDQRRSRNDYVERHSHLSRYVHKYRP